MTPDIKACLLEILQSQEQEQVKLLDFSHLSGGCINDAARVETSLGVYFVKWNDGTRFPGMFQAEGKGLEILEKSGTLRVPRFIGCGNAGKDDILVLEYIEQAGQAPGFWKDFASGLARMHLNSSPQFGLDHDNYIGSLPQTNRPAQSWVSFFVEHRLNVQLEMALRNRKAGRELETALERLYPHLGDIFPEEPPALLHGDLWSGNFMTGSRGEAVIIDPAVYYGHRYMDLGMSKLFGGFAPEFYEHYHALYPLENNWQKALDIANLYPLLVHVNLFGGGYLNSVMAILKRMGDYTD